MINNNEAAHTDAGDFFYQGEVDRIGNLDKDKTLTQVAEEMARRKSGSAALPAEEPDYQDRRSQSAGD